jgi:hypothetical protein
MAELAEGGMPLKAAPPSRELGLGLSGACGIPHWAALVQQKLLLLGSTVVDDEAIRDAVAAVHRLPRKRREPEATERQRSKAAVAREVDAIVPLLPRLWVRDMLGGELGERQVVGDARRAALLSSRLEARAGSDGDRVASLRSLLATSRKHALTVMGASLSDCDDVLFPMSMGLAYELVQSEHARATAAGRGSKSGASVGNSVREELILAASLGCPVAADKDSLKGAAPPPSASLRSKAGALPLAIKCQLERQAAGETLDDLSPEAQEVVQFYAASLIAWALDQGVRVAEGVRVEVFPDEGEPDAVMRGRAFMGKDGAPVELYAPAEGFTGAYEWFPAHLGKVVERGQPFPAWEKPHGSGGAIEKATGLLPHVARKQDMRAAFKALAMRPPLSLSAEEWESINVQGHTLHVAGPEWARCITQKPRPPVPLPAPLVAGFDGADCDALGHWLRDPGAKAQAAAAQAAADAAPAEARRAAAIAALPGRPSQRGAMRVYYGQAGALQNRSSERFIQLDVRQRLVHTVRHMLAGRDWRELPRGIADLDILRPPPL